MTEPDSLPLPQRVPLPFLPIPGELVVDDSLWSFQPEKGGPRGYARLRVWRGLHRGHLAVVTPVDGHMSVTTAAAHIWKTLYGQYGPALALAELWPEGAGLDGELHLDLVLVAPGSQRAAWQRLYPTNPEHPLHDFASLWWLAAADDILS
jgi:hypothetical protein